MIVTTLAYLSFSVGKYYYCCTIDPVALAVFDRLVFSLLEKISSTTKMVNKEGNHNVHLETQIGL